MSIDRVLRYGMNGDDVKEWQVILLNSGYDLSPNNKSGKFDDATHNATVAWQKAHGLNGDGVVGPKTLDKVGSESIESNVSKNLDIKFIQATNYRIASRSDIRWIVLHSMEAGEASTTAENVSKWFASGKGAPMASAHYCIDDDSIVQCVKDEHVAFHAGTTGNKYGIGIELAGYARQTKEQWLDNFSYKMLKQAAQLTANLCKKFNIPAEFKDRKGLKNNEKGITTHNEITFAFRESTHIDPGPNFPMDLYISWVKEYMGE
jgi:N-acetyl-anhydromuramyl-L-alanine amidase AmpD